MFRELYKEEFYYIVKDMLNNDEFLKTKEKIHHGINRYDHLMRVSYYSFLITKLLRLNYRETTIAALLHDFYTDEVENCLKVKALQLHPLYALENAKKYYKLSLMQEDIIKNHMFPVTIRPPKYLESWIVDLVDDAAGIYEQYKSSCKQLKEAITFMMILAINIIQK